MQWCTSYMWHVARARVMGSSIRANSYTHSYIVWGIRGIRSIREGRRNGGGGAVGLGGVVNEGRLRWIFCFLFLNQMDGQQMVRKNFK